MPPLSGVSGVSGGDFYRELTERNSGFVKPAAQDRLRQAWVLIAGCGSTGGAAVEPLARLGVQHFLLADNGSYEPNNLNRQNAYQHDIGRNKAEICAERVLGINPAAMVTVDRDGIRPDSVDEMVADCDVVIDGVDVTERGGWRAKYELHASACRHRRPVISGWDMAGTQYVRFYDYRVERAPFDGRISASDVEHLGIWMLLHRAVPMRMVPTEMLEHARERAANPEVALSQVVYASLLFGAIASRMVVDVLDGQRVRRHVLIDGHRAVRSRRANVAMAVRKPLVAVLSLKDLFTTASDSRAVR